MYVRVLACVKRPHGQFDVELANGIVMQSCA